MEQICNFKEFRLIYIYIFKDDFNDKLLLNERLEPPRNSKEWQVNLELLMINLLIFEEHRALELQLQVALEEILMPAPNQSSNPINHRKYHAG